MADSTPNSNYIPSSSLSHSVEEDILTIDDQQTNNEVKDSDEVVVVVAPQAIVRGTFDTPQEAKQQAGFLLHRFHNVSGGGTSKHILNRYVCASKKSTGCTARRQVRWEFELGTEKKVYVVLDKGAHNHQDVATGERQFLPHVEREVLKKLLSGSHLAPAKLQAQAANHGISLTAERCRQTTSKGLKRVKPAENFLEWLQADALDLEEESCYLQSVHVDGEDWVACIASDEMLHVQLAPGDTLIMDGNPTHTQVGTIMMLGKVSNASTNAAHTFVPMCVGVISTGEHSRGIKNFLVRVMELRGRPFETNLWRVDGHMGLRAGIEEAVRQVHTATQSGPPQAVVAMDLFHVIQSVTMQGKLLPSKSELSSAVHDIMRLADVPRRFHDRAREAMLNKWRTRPNWERFTRYFVETFLEKLGGWWGESLGEGTPRTTGGVEGRWPGVHALLGGKCSPQYVIENVVQKQSCTV